jgi:hypothetical protein
VQHDILESKHASLHVWRTENLQVATNIRKTGVAPTRACRYFDSRIERMHKHQQDSCTAGETIISRDAVLNICKCLVDMSFTVIDQDMAAVDLLRAESLLRGRVYGGSDFAHAHTANLPRQCKSCNITMLQHHDSIVMQLSHAPQANWIP